MKAKTICPKCKKEIIDNCEDCIKRNSLVCSHIGTNVKTEEEGVPDIFEDIKWEIIKK